MNTRIEVASRPSLRMTIAAEAIRRTVRPMLDGFSALEPVLPSFRGPFLWVSSHIEVPLKVMVPVPGTRCEPVDLGTCRGEWVRHGADQDGPPHGAVLYFHGGGFLFGGMHSHRRLASRIARESGLPVLNVDYRQLPQAGVRESQADALAAYQYLLGVGVPADRVIFAGDSAGGGLALSTAIGARSLGLPMPAGIMALSPLADYGPDARFGHPNDQVDPMLSALSISTALRFGVPDGDPALSPLNHDFTGLPPVLVQVGSTEVFLEDALSVQARCRDVGVPCELQVWGSAIHVFQAFADLAPEGHRAIAEMGRFARELVAPEAAALRSVGTAA